MKNLPYFLTVLLFFSLGVIVWFIFPRDAQIPEPRTVASTILIQSEDNCTTYQDVLVVDTTIIHGTNTTNCNK